MPYTCVLIAPKGVHRIAGAVAVERLGEVTEVGICRHETVLSGIENELVVVRNREHRAPREFARDDVAGGESDLDSTVASVSHIREICVISRALVRLHRE